MSQFTASPLRRLLCALALAFVTALTFAAPVQAAPVQSACATYHTVGVGENLFRIGLQYGISWTVIQKANGLTNANFIVLGQKLCIPYTLPPVTPPPTRVPGTVTPVPTGTAPAPVGGYPRIDFNVRNAKPGDTITITGVNFPPNEAADILIAPFVLPYTLTSAYVPVASTTTLADGKVNTSFTLPTTLNNAPITGAGISIMVKGKVSGYYGFNFVWNR
jgi:LysM repeat protein